MTDLALPGLKNLAEKPVRSPLAGRMGGKSRLARKLLTLIPQHLCYVEPFCGAAWLLFCKRPEVSPLEVINDLDCELINFFHVLRDNGEAFAGYMRWALTSRHEFETLKAQKPEELEPVARAWRYYYLLRCGFGGKVNNPGFGYARKPPMAWGICVPWLGKRLAAAHARLANVIIECLPYGQILRRYDCETTFFYLDPPYIGSENDYGRGMFSRAEFANLAVKLKRLKGKFMLSLNDCPYARELFAGFCIREVTTVYSCGKEASFRVGELVICNYELPERID